ncbi:MAG: lipopolysaccharide kinase InaA family protein [Propionivibrio sp.]
MNDFIDQRWRPILAFNGLDSFESLWQTEADWFEPPNQRRGGWSGVCRCELRLPTGETCAVFLKRQENHGARTLLHPIHGRPTFLREFRRIMTYREYGVPSLEPVFFGMRGRGNSQRAILVTKELMGFRSLDDCVRGWIENGLPSRHMRRDVVDAVASLTRKMHASRIRHGCYYPKHVFVRLGEEGCVEARVIDLEKSRRHPLRLMCTLRDLHSLNYYAQSLWSRTDRLRFLKKYLGITTLTGYAKWLWRRVAARSGRKSLARMRDRTG